MKESERLGGIREKTRKEGEGYARSRKEQLYVL
jgi:hypothetical protein